MQLRLHSMKLQAFRTSLALLPPVYCLQPKAGPLDRQTIRPFVSEPWNRRGAISAGTAAGISSCFASPTAAFFTSAPVSPDAPEPDNIFFKILKGEAPADVVEDDPQSDLFTFRDKRPASTLHLLIIPRRFIRDASLLELSDADLVQRMEAKARELVIAEVGEDTFRERDLALGFHWPPWYSVPWLHLHAIYPKSQMKRRYKYTAFSFKSPEYVLRRIGACPTQP